MANVDHQYYGKHYWAAVTLLFALFKMQILIFQLEVGAVNGLVFFELLVVFENGRIIHCHCKLFKFKFEKSKFDCYSVII